MTNKATGMYSLKMISHASYTLFLEEYNRLVHHFLTVHTKSHCGVYTQMTSNGQLTTL